VSDLAYSPWGALRAVRASLVSGLAAVIADVNAEILAAGGLQELATPTIRLRAQVPQHPGSQLPLIVIVTEDESYESKPFTPNQQRGEQVMGVSLAIFDQGVEHLGAGDVLAQDAEEDLVLRMRAWNQAVLRCLRRQASQDGALGAGGIQQIRPVSRAQLLFSVSASLVDAAAEVMQIELQIKTR